MARYFAAAKASPRLLQSLILGVMLLNSRRD